MTHIPRSAEVDRVLAEIDRAEESIKSRDDLIALIRLLPEAVDAGAFDRINAFKFLDGLENRLFGIKGWCRNNGESVPERPDWRWLGRMLTGAFY